MPISQSGKARLAVTLGDPAGIGPEVTLKALHRLKSLKKEIFSNVLLLGRASFFSKLANRLKLNLSFRDVRDAEKAFGKGAALPCFLERSIPENIRPGKQDVTGTSLAVLAIETAVRLAMRGTVGAIVTPPIHKAGLKKAGFDMPGHTEYLAKLSETKRFEMMLVGGPLRVVPVTRHVALKKVPSLLSRKKIMDAILLTALELENSFGISRPKLAICGLNPHAGEEGVMGTEEIRFIAPAVRAAQQKTRARLFGPLSPDALFHDAYVGRYDAVICMYHDQGLIPLKMISRGHGVNVTLGLPFVRTSPDHGTAYDIAPFFKADPGSMIEAMVLAFRLATKRKK